MTNTGAPLEITGVPLGPFATNCYAVADTATGSCWVIDASFDPARLISLVRKREWKVEAIILTHAHVDHIAGLEEVREAFAPAPVVIHRDEEAWLGDPTLNLSLAMGESVECRPPDRIVEGGEQLLLGEHVFRVLHTPGHSPGSITLWCPRSEIALVGDTLFNGSIGRFDFPSSDGPTLANSIRNVLYAMPKETRVFPGHGPETTIGHEMETNPYVRADGVAQEMMS